MRQPIDAPRRGVLVSLAAFCLTGCATSRSAVEDSEDARLRAARFLLLGEVHDNAEQHRMRAALLSRLLSDGRPTAVVFEQIDRGHDAALDGAAQDAESVATAGQLDRKGWGWPLHRPIIEAALAGRATLRGGDLSNGDARAIVQRGAAAVPDELRPLLATADWTASDEARVEQEIDSGHCGALPPRLWPAMALAQRARDAALAEAMLRAAGDRSRVVLIAGNGHVRRDLGVPRYLLAAGVPQAQIVAVGFLESAGTDAPTYDIVRITPAVERPDPCEAFRKN